MFRENSENGKTIHLKELRKTGETVREITEQMFRENSENRKSIYLKETSETGKTENLREIRRKE